MAGLRNLSFGMNGEDVRAVQNGLNQYFGKRRPALDPDGKFGQHTLDAVNAFQKENPGTARSDGTPDGDFGPLSRQALFPLVVATATMIGVRTSPPTASAKPLVKSSFASASSFAPVGNFAPASLGLGIPTDPLILPILTDTILQLIHIPGKDGRIAAPAIPSTPPVKNFGELWVFDHKELVPGGQTTFGFSKDRQDAATITTQAIFSKGPPDGKHQEIAAGVQAGLPLHAKPGDGSAWTVNPFLQLTDVDRLGALGRFHLWQPYGQIGVQGTVARRVSPTVTAGVFPFNLGFDASSRVTFSIAFGGVFNWNIITGATQFGAQFTFGASMKFGSPK